MRRVVNISAPSSKDVRINGRVNAPKVRLIGANGQQIGIVSSSEALSKAQEAGLDLVEISPQAAPPVCRIMDFGKYQYEESKRRHAAKRKQKHIQVKEIKFRPGTGIGDYQTKLRALIRFLENGDKTKITLRFRGREMAHQELGMEMLKRIENDLKEYATVETFPRLEGRQMTMVLAPGKKGGAKEAPLKASRKETKEAPKKEAGGAQ
jgi:translation initiation factor IF-3